MIKINLLPYDLRPITRTPLPHIISLAVLAVSLVFMGHTFLTLNSEASGISKEIAAQQSALDLLDATVSEYEQLQEQKQQLQTMVQTIQTILKDRTIWSEHLHQLTTLTPDNIWYKRVRLLSRRMTEERVELNSKTGKPVIDKKTNEPKMTRVNITRYVLEISGYAIDDEAGLNSTATLAANTTVDPEFSKAFKLITSKIGDTEFNGFQVREFVFEYLVS